MTPFPVNDNGLTLWDWRRVIGKKFTMVWRMGDFSYIPGYNGELLKFKRLKMDKVKQSIVNLIYTIFPYTIGKDGVNKLADYIVSEFLVGKFPESFCESVVKYMFVHPKNIKDAGIVARFFEAEIEVCGGNTFYEEVCYSAHLIYTLKVENLEDFHERALKNTNRIPILEAIVEAFSQKSNIEKFDSLRLSYRPK